MTDLSQSATECMYGHPSRVDRHSKHGRYANITESLHTYLEKYDLRLR